MSDKLYSLMPPAGKVGLWLYLRQYLARIGEIKSASDIFNFTLKVLPGLLTFIIIPILAVSAVYFAKSVKITYKSHSPLFLVAISFLITLLISQAITSIVKKRLHRKLIAFDPHHDFEILQYAVVGHIISETKAVYAFRYLVKPRREGVNIFPVIFNWSGEGNVTILPRNSRYAAGKPKKIPGNFSKGEIHLNDEARDGVPIIVEYVLNTADSLSTIPSRHLGISINSKKYPLLNTHLIISFEATCPPISLRREMYLGGFGLGPIEGQIVNLRANDSYHWPLWRVFNWSYCIAWDFGR
ncbi:hypothetical protein [Sphingomonas sp. RT2P30]|uniref:hypothetical protein n=1 Tax=Parasphingomonas halimpatiens TaxID=3096162 RepID=UPI002FC98903